MESIVTIVAIISIATMSGIFALCCVCLNRHEGGRYKHDFELKSTKISIKSSTKMDIDKHESTDIKNK